MNDLGGTFTYSSLRSVHMNSVSDLTVNAYPNPSADQIFIRMQDWSQVEKIQVVDSKGRIVFISKGKPADHIQVKNLLPEIYILRITLADRTILSRKVVSAF